MSERETEKQLIIVGNGMVGQRMVDELIGAGATATWNIIVVGEEPRRAYDRVALSSWFEGTSTEELSLVDDAAMARAGVVYRTDTLVQTIDRRAKSLALSDGSALSYDHLVLATGSSPFVPPIPGRDASGCFVYRTIDDLEQIAAYAQRPGCSIGTVIGGGLLGLEAANALRSLGLETHVVEMAPHLMPQQLNADAAEMLARHVAGLGVRLHLGASTSEIVSWASRVRGLVFGDGTDLATDLLIFSAGIRPRDGARESGLAVGERGGVVVDDRLLTSDKAISAVGEVACHNGFVYGLVAPGYDMARTIARRLTGQDEVRFESGDLSAKLKLLGVDVASFGSSVTDAPDLDVIVHRDPTTLVHRELVVDADGRVRGGTLVGDASGYQLLRMMALDEMETPAQVAALVLPDGLSTLELDSGDLADSAGVCSCNTVTAGDIRLAVDQGCRTTTAIGACTGAGTSCAGCVPAVTDIMHAALEASGQTVDHSLCEHFAHTRQELFDLVRFHRHASWAAVLAAHGTGAGCAVCRPTVGSILASLANGYILDGDQAGLQDTNDHALANMQRNGTYSVVPRVPGGEITPDQLIALGEIAKDYDLYTKVTGAYLLAKTMRTGSKRRMLTAHGTLYRALHRLERAKLLEAFWEDPGEAELEGRPRRRRYRLTALAQVALNRARSQARAPGHLPTPERGLEAS